jgi:anti-sigma B factor antagonist
VNFHANARLAGTRLVVAFQGELDAVDAPEAAAAVAALKALSQCVILDLGALDFIDCVALRALQELRERAWLAGGDILLAAPRVTVQRILALTQLDTWFCVYATVAAAVRGGA